MSNIRVSNERSFTAYQIMHIGLIGISIIALLGTGIAEYIFSISPCPLCIYQRLTYLVIIKLSLTEYYSNKVTYYNKHHIKFIILTLLFAIFLSLYHAGVERDLLELSPLCSHLINIPDYLSISDVEKILYTSKAVSCKQSTIEILGVRMSEWNSILNIIMLLVVLAVGAKGRIYAKA